MSTAAYLTFSPSPNPCTSQQCRDREKLLKKVMKQLNRITSWLIDKYGNKESFPPPLKKIFNDDDAEAEIAEFNQLSLSDDDHDNDDDEVLFLVKPDPNENHAEPSTAADPLSTSPARTHDNDSQGQTADVKIEPDFDSCSIFGSDNDNEFDESQYDQNLVKPCSVKLIRLSTANLKKKYSARRARAQERKKNANDSKPKRSSIPKDKDATISKPKRSSIPKDKDATISKPKVPRQRKEHKCEFCSKIFRHKYALKIHRMTHTGETQFTCGECGRGFIRKEAYLGHILRHKGEETHVCPYPACFKSFATRKDVRQHQVIHNEGRNYKCELCPESFQRRSQLQKHRATHSGKSRFTCEVCGKGYEYKHVLMTHMMTHNPDNVFQCDVRGCRRKYSDQQALEIHKKKSHTSTPPSFICERCGKTFLDNATLKRHHTVHINTETDNLLHCKICGKGFAAKRYLDDHVKVVHDPNREPQPEKPLKCDLCPASYTHNKSLNDHKRKKHGLDKNSVPLSLDN